MKRSPLKRKSGLERTGQLRRAPLKAKPPSLEDGPALREFFVAVCVIPPVDPDPDRWRLRKCVNCGHRCMDAHHLIAKQSLKAMARTLRIDHRPLIADPRNGIPLCRLCHDTHEAGVRRLKRHLIPDVAWRFARELDERLGNHQATERLNRRYYP